MSDHPSLSVSGLPRLGMPAPVFEADSTHGRIALGDFSGSWLVLFSHPADFTPVCTTEFLAFARAQEEFEKRGAVLLGLSIDSIYAHLAWLQRLEEKFGVRVNFPVIADHNRAVATAYGMVMPGESKTEASRCLFVIDPNGVVRAMIYYPMSAGRSIPEVLRLLDSLQLTTSQGLATPANWQPGDKAIEPAPRTIEEARVRAADPTADDWFYRLRQPKG
ncbi:peroxiredoxin [Lacibacterium aquatile]|uniref:Peroxiredoxin n=1 Tax=Lacibacterium aquatile TaxID=1168082 RepID=A0ABW5DQD5_9PROT